MKHIQVFRVLMVMMAICNFSLTLQARGEVDAKTITWAKNNAGMIAQALWKDYSPSHSEPISFDDIVRYLPLSVDDATEIKSYDNYFSLDQQDFIVGVVQAELEQSALGFSGKQLPADNVKKLTDYEKSEAAMRSWVQKNSNKILKYLSKNQITSIGEFDQIVQACAALKITLPKTDLSAMDQEVLIDQINSGLELLNADVSFKILELDKAFSQTFDKRQFAYIQEYLIPKLLESGFESFTLSSLDAFLAKLSKKSMAAVGIQVALHKAQPVIQQEIIQAFNEELLKDPKILARKLARIVLVIKAIYESVKNKFIDLCTAIVNGPVGDSVDKTTFMEQIKKLSQDQIDMVIKELGNYQKSMNSDKKIKATDKSRMNANYNWMLNKLD